MHREDEYYRALAGLVALPDVMSCSLVEFAGRLKYYLMEE
jgi:hypothetical protein